MFQPESPSHSTLVQTLDETAIPIPRRQPLPRSRPVTSDSNQRPIHDSRILIVDDEPLVVRTMARYLASDGYDQILTFTDSRQAFERMKSQPPDVVLLDMMMPSLGGIDILKLRQTDERLKNIPFLIMSAGSEKAIKREALEFGATDFLAKPVDPFDLILRVQNSLLVKQHQDCLRDVASELEKQVRLRTQQIERSREQVVHCLAKAAEFRDNETGAHIIRVGKYAAVIANELGFDPIWCSQIQLAAQLHDVGKIGIPDSILLHPGKLSGGQFEIMKEHCILGCQIIEPLALCATSGLKKNATGQFVIGADSTMLGLAANIARTHHEKWDGSGYPDGLSGEAIPIEGRITSVADVFDALRSERPYKPGFPREKCLEIMLSERGTRFNPLVLDAFFKRLDDIDRISDAHQDQPLANATG